MKKVFNCYYSKTRLSFTHWCQAVIFAEDKEQATNRFLAYLNIELKQGENGENITVKEEEVDFILIGQGSN